MSWRKCSFTSLCNLIHHNWWTHWSRFLEHSMWLQNSMIIKHRSALSDPILWKRNKSNPVNTILLFTSTFSIKFWDKKWNPWLWIIKFVPWLIVKTKSLSFAHSSKLHNFNLGVVPSDQFQDTEDFLSSNYNLGTN